MSKDLVRNKNKLSRQRHNQPHKKRKDQRREEKSEEQTMKTKILNDLDQQLQKEKKTNNFLNLAAYNRYGAFGVSLNI